MDICKKNCNVIYITRQRLLTIFWINISEIQLCLASFGCFEDHTARTYLPKQEFRLCELKDSISEMCRIALYDVKLTRVWKKPYCLNKMLITYLSDRTALSKKIKKKKKVERGQLRTTSCQSELCWSVTSTPSFLMDGMKS